MIGSLFSGIGGIELGLESCGLGPVVWQCDNDPHARAVLATHWPSVRRYSDVREIDATATRVDVVCGGFPCQPHSFAGKRRGTSDDRWIWPEFARVIAAIDPPFVFIENVPGLRTSGLRDVLADLAEMRFDAVWDYFSACESGAAHTRERLFLLAYADGIAGEKRIRARIEAVREIQDRHDKQMPPDVRMESDGELQRMADGLPRQVDRLRLLGNSVVPQQAALAWRTLTARATTSAREVG